MANPGGSAGAVSPSRRASPRTASALPTKTPPLVKEAGELGVRPAVVGEALRIEADHGVVGKVRILPGVAAAPVLPAGGESGIDHDVPLGVLRVREHQHGDVVPGREDPAVDLDRL